MIRFKYILFLNFIIIFNKGEISVIYSDEILLFKFYL